MQGKCIGADKRGSSAAAWSRVTPAMRTWRLQPQQDDTAKREHCAARIMSKTVFSFCEPKAAGHIQRRLL